MECTKIRYKTKEEAREHLIKIVEQPEHKPWNEKKPCRHYRCPHCGDYHLTSQPTIDDIISKNSYQTSSEHEA